MKMKNILFYHYVHIDNPEKLRIQLRGICRKLNLLGKILIGKEGMNGCLTGLAKDTHAFMKTLQKNQKFELIDFKIGKTTHHNFKKLIIKTRKEIVTLKLRKDVDLRNKAPYIEPKAMKQMLDNGEDLILVDARNEYESRIGRFKNAITPPLQTFADWLKVVKQLKKFKNKKIITYCTGGIRCEKASAYLREQGFSDVLQLHGGIIRYGQECGNAHWEGKCFVFDTRGAIDIDPKNQLDPITQCELCNLPCDDYHNCALVTCDKRFICCGECLKVLQGCCSKQCRNIHNNQSKRMLITATT